MAVTPNYSWAYPTVNADADAWGTILNTMAIAIDASLKTVDTATAAAALKANNLSDLANAGTARTNLGLGTSATYAAQGDQAKVATINSSFVATHFPSFNASGALVSSNTGPLSYCQAANNLSDVASAATSRTNLGLGSIATHNVTISTSAPSGGSDGDFWYVYV